MFVNATPNFNFAEGVAWDWVNLKLYWTSSLVAADNVTISTIEVMDVDTGCSKALARFDDGTKASAIVLDPIRG